MFVNRNGFMENYGSMKMQRAMLLSKP